jgi:hypothetical protein
MYWKQNSNPEDFGIMLKQFIHRLSHRDHAAKKQVVEGIEIVTTYIDENLHYTR